MSSKRWSDEEWRICLKCFAECDTSDDAVERFRRFYPERSAGAVLDKLQNSGVSIKETLKEGAQTKIRHEKLTNARLKSDNDSLRRELEGLRQEVITSGDIKEFLHALKAAEIDTRPEWLVEKTKTGMTGIPVLFLSDIHFDEVVNPAEVEGVNEYNREIAVRRIQNTFQTAIDLCQNYFHKPKYEGVVCALGGDLLSGQIHEELAESNEYPILQSAVDLTELLCQGIMALADSFGKVFVPGVVGNHGRLHKKPRAKGRVKNNFEWLIYHNIARHFAGDERVTFCIPDSADLTFTVYNKTFLLTHGDQFRGGSGISGVFSPLMIGHARKQKRQQAVKKPFDIMMMGHWHQYIHTETLIVNGCFIKDEMTVLYDGTHKPIQDIVVGEKVLSHSGHSNIVLETLKRPYSGQLFKIWVGPAASEINCTSEHPILAIKGNQTTSGVPNNTTHRDRRGITPTDYKPEWIPARLLSVGDYIQMTRPVEELPPADGHNLDFMRFLGLYLAEGSSSGRDGKLHHSTFSLHIDEEKYGQFIHDVAEKHFGDNSTGVMERPHKTLREVCIYRSAAAKELVDLCGKGARHKQIRADIMGYPKEHLYQMLLGWLEGDGHIRKFNKKGGRFVCARSVSDQLLNQMMFIALKCGLRPSRMGSISGQYANKSGLIGFTGDNADQITRDMDLDPESGQVGDGVGHKYLEHNQQLFVRITNIWSDYVECDVYNLEVENDNSYTINNLAVHNSIKGMDEYAYISNFGFEKPQQALFVVHPKHGITYRMPVQCDHTETHQAKPLVVW